MARNTNRQGADFELDIMHYLAGCTCEATYKSPKHIGWRGFGYDCARSSGSHGAVDVFAIGAWIGGGVLGLAKRTLYIQAKITNPMISPAERRKVVDWAGRSGALPLVGYKLEDATTGRVRPHFRLLTGTGPRDWVVWEPGEDS